MRPTHPLMLGQAAPTPGDILGPLAWIVVAAVALALIALCLRVWLKGRSEDSGDSIGLGFTLADLRAMREAGDLDEAEFETARAKLIGRTRGEAEEATGPPRATGGGIVWDPPSDDGDSGVSAPR